MEFVPLTAYSTFLPFTFLMVAPKSKLIDSDIAIIIRLTFWALPVKLTSYNTTH